MAIDMHKKATRNLTDVLKDKTGTVKEPTKQVSLYLPISKHRKLKMEATRRGTSMTKIIEEWIENELPQEQE
ncbi:MULTISPECIES: plasmid partition protein ParG [Bifidobacterium]|jgi:predicted HicB family RNase H-like nuclease|uniref:Uncharacterized protein n=1 Tax=Bifidobacterium mongoliense TaxID=518643 RepID=A0A423UC37_9BIFI|nr:MULTISPECIES: plasmid partition protein ParG [Bifidobacterium]MCI1225374.1 hypothetical protein [Bifidobacterium sp.]ROT86279.1 hypothetical protein BMONG18_1599 [Bifidobacterium mongoliense]